MAHLTRNIIIVSIGCIAIFLIAVWLNSTDANFNPLENHDRMLRDGIIPPPAESIVSRRHVGYSFGKVWDYVPSGESSLKLFLDNNVLLKRSLQPWDPEKAALSRAISELRVTPEQYAHVDANPPKLPYALDVAIARSEDGKACVFIGVRKTDGSVTKKR